MPQWMAYLSPADELFYGGAAGGGKTDLLLGLALTAHQSSIVYRREFTQLVGATGIIDRSKDLIGDHGVFNAHENTWRNILGTHRSLEFGATKLESDVRKYMGRPHDFKGFDEGTQFSEYQYRFLSAWARTTDPDQRVRVVLAGNPPHTVEGRWVIRYWGPWIDKTHRNPAAPGELRWFATVGGQDLEVDGPEPIEHEGETIIPKSRTFIPARLSDNPFLRDTGYDQVLHGLPEPLRSQLLYGDFTAAIQDDPWQVISSDWITIAQGKFKEGSPPEIPITALGVDVARGGIDYTAIAIRRDNWITEVKKWPGSRTPSGQSVVTLIVELLGENTDALINVDVIGVGSSVFDILRELGYNVRAINAGQTSFARTKEGLLRLRNVRAELWWRAREALDPQGEDNLVLPDDPEIMADLTSPKWGVGISGIQVEDKQRVKDRLGRSTNIGDAVIMALKERTTYFA